MISVVSLAAFVGFVHSIANPGHWLPVVLMTKSRRWNRRTALLGSLAAASGHIVVSIALALVGIGIGAQVLSEETLEEIERHSGLALAAFGLAYAVWAYFRHSSCHGHTHHGPKPEKRKAPFLFLFSLGFSPCVAVIPVFAAAAPLGLHVLLLTLLAFALGVISALAGATLLGSFGIMKLDHPILEHYGDVITGAGVVIMGLILFFLPHSH